MEDKSKETVLECDICLREIPDTVSANAEADEYVAHYCGLDCYSQWLKNNPSET